MSSGSPIYAIVFLCAFIIMLVVIIYFAILKRLKIKKNGGVMPVQRPQTNPEYERFVFRDDKDPEFITPKEVQPYEFYCSNCNEKSLGYSIYCSKCGVRMKLLSSATHKRPKDVKEQDKTKCVLCHSDKCPVCQKPLIGKPSCHEECPFCERIYHEHCWINTIKNTGKCSFCLESPPPEMLMDK